ncbi:MAG: formate dehydrogenase accessory protein FdhE [Planctomycetota bacterium]
MELREVVDYYKRQSPQISELIDFFYRTYQLQNQYVNQISPVLPLPNDAAIKKLQDGKYLFEDIRWSINKTVFKDIINELFTLLKPRCEKTDGLEKALLNIPESVPNNLPDLVGNLTKSIPALSDTEKETLCYLIWQALKVFYRKEAEQFGALDYRQYWSKPVCPVCGGLPKISQLQKDTGKRLLVCHQCWTKWPVTRIICHYCGNTDQDKLAYFYADDNRSYRVDVCYKCKKYLKTIDEKSIGREVIPEVEDIITYHLDTLAISQGYQNPFAL